MEVAAQMTVQIAPSKNPWAAQIIICANRKSKTKDNLGGNGSVALDERSHNATPQSRYPVTGASRPTAVDPGRPYACRRTEWPLARLKWGGCVYTFTHECEFDATRENLAQPHLENLRCLVPLPDAPQKRSSQFKG